MIALYIINDFFENVVRNHEFYKRNDLFQN